MRSAHGLLIVRDEESTATHDHWDPAESGISVEPDSIHLAVQNAVDGLVTVNVIEGGVPDPGVRQVCVEVDEKVHASLANVRIQPVGSSG